MGPSGPSRSVGRSNDDENAKRKNQMSYMHEDGDFGRKVVVGGEEAKGREEGGGEGDRG